MVDINEIWKFELRKGNSKNPREGACLLDAVSWLEYGTLGDHPACVCPVFAAFGRRINDVMSDAGRQRLKLFIPRLVGTVDPEHERERAEYLAWQAIRVFAPLALDAVGQHKHATVLRNFTGSLAEAAAAARAARAAAAAARAAAPEAAARAAATRAAAGAARAAAVWAAEEAAEEAAEAARAAARAAAAEAEDAMIAALEGVLAIGRQAKPVEPARFDAAVRLFEEARG
jgi:hypothetical protein